MPTVGFLSHRLHSAGGQELCEHAIARGLFDRSWRIVNVHEESGDLAADWDAMATIHREPSLADPTAAARTTALLRECDVLYVHSTELLAHALEVGRAIDVPVVSHLHLPPFHVRHGLRRLLRGHHKGDAAPEVFSRSTRITRFLSVSRFNARLWIESGIPADRIEVVPNGVDTARFRPATPHEKQALRSTLGLAPDALVFVFVGRIDPEKGIDQLLTAHASFSQRSHRPSTLLVVGEPSVFKREEGDAYLERLQRRSPDVVWMGKRRDVELILRAADVAVVPSQWDEPFGLIAVEAMASGLPVIASMRGGLTEILRGPLERGLSQPAPRAIARKMHEFADDDVLRATLGAHARQIAVDRFGLDAMAGEVDRQLLSLVATRSDH